MGMIYNNSKQFSRRSVDIINKEYIGKKIYELRKKSGLTQRQLADRLGVTNRAVSKWENGLSSPAAEMLYKICNCFCISTDFFMREAGEQKSENKSRNGMQSITELYRIGFGPSSSHTMGPERICREFLRLNREADSFKVVLYGSLAHTGVGHGTNVVIKKVFSPKKTEVEIDGVRADLPHPNTMQLFAYKDGKCIDERFAYSIGGGEIQIDGVDIVEHSNIYKLCSFSDISKYCKEKQIRIWQYVEEVEGPGVWDFLAEVWETMKRCIKMGIETEGVLPGGLNVTRKAGHLFNRTHIDESRESKENRLVCAYAYAVGEQNAAGETVVTAPTCGASGVLPAVLYYNQHKREFTDKEILRALATASVVGNLIKTNASISGAECGCQAEIGSACSMAAAALGELYEMSIDQIEYAAEIAIEHHLGLTCDPIRGLVQIPCIERNAVAAMRAINAVALSNILVDTRKMSFDIVVETMYETGKDLSRKYRETSIGGLAKLYDR